MIVPDKYIRKAISEDSRIEVPIYEGAIPIDIVDIPKIYGIVTSQSRNRAYPTKFGHDWFGIITITLVKINEKGSISTAELDDLEGQVCEAFEDIKVDGFKVNRSNFIGSEIFTYDSLTNTVSQKAITYEIWVNKAV